MISIAQRLRLFSHRPRTQCLIPGTSTIVEAYPTLVRVKSWQGEIVQEISLVTGGGLVEQFLVVQDLERGCVTLSSTSYRFHIFPDLQIVWQRGPSTLAEKGAAYSLSDRRGKIDLGSRERLSLGVHKQQEWEKIVERCDFREIFPYWLRLGSLLSLPLRAGDDKGMFGLLARVSEAIALHRPEHIIPAYRDLFLSGFGHMLIPRAVDEDYRGSLPFDMIPSVDSPLYLLVEGAMLIRSLFVRIRDQEIYLLPNLPPQCAEGRITDVDCPSFGRLSLDWSKKMLKKVILYAERSAEVMLRFPSYVREVRVRIPESGEEFQLPSGDFLALKPHSHYLIDHVRK